MANSETSTHIWLYSFGSCTERRKNKLDSKASNCIFLGYGIEIKAYRSYDPERRRVFHTRDVTHLELSSYSIEEEPSAKKEEEKHQDLVQFL